MKDTAAITKRLKRIEGQIRGIIRMIEDEKACEEVLIQISSAKAALQKTGQLVLEDYLGQCVLEEARGGQNEEETLKKLTSAIEQFSRII